MKKYILSVLLLAALIYSLSLIGLKPAYLAKAESLPENVKTCLISKLGQKVFDEIYSGEKNPTKAEIQKGAECFKNDQMIKKDAKTVLPTSVETCIKGVIGKTLEQAGDLTDEQRTQIDAKCFQTTGAPSIIQFPTETMTCIKKILGQEKFNSIMEGKSKPSNEEKRKVAPVCFNMPPPPSTEEINKIPVAQRECMEKILGGPIDSLESPPTAEQEQRMQTECFAAGGPGDQQGGQLGEPGANPDSQPGNRPGGPGGRPDISDAALQCLLGKLGTSADQLFSKPLTSSEEQAMSECTLQFPK